MVLCLLLAFLGRQEFGRGQFTLFGIVQHNALFFNVLKKVIAQSQGMVQVFYTVEDEVHGSAHVARTGEFGLYLVLYPEFLLQIFVGEHHEHVIIAPVFVGDALFHIGVLYPVAAGVAAKEQHHFHLFKGGEQVGEAAQLILLGFR